MMKRIIGNAMMKKAMKQIQGGPQAMMKMSPVKGSGIKLGRGQAPARLKNYIGKQNPAFTPKTGGLIRPKRMK